MDRDQKRQLSTRARAEQAAIRAVLLQWDPIGDVPDDEYDCLIGPIHGMLARNASEGEISAWLTANAQDHFGMGPDTESDAVAAGELMKAWRRLPDHRSASSR